MKKIILPLVSIVSVLFLANWGAPDDSSVEGRKKPNINFHGMLKTRQGQKRKIANVTIGRMVRQIPVYEVPTGPDFVDKKTHAIKKDPKTSLVVTRIDLSEIDELKVPNPDTIWTYQKDSKSRKKEFIEIEIISKDKKKTKNNYLIDSNKKVYCDGVNKSGPEEMDVPLQAIASLKLSEYTYRDANKPKKENPKTEAVPAA